MSFRRIALARLRPPGWYQRLRTAYPAGGAVAHIKDGELEALEYAAKKGRTFIFIGPSREFRSELLLRVLARAREADALEKRNEKLRHYAREYCTHTCRQGCFEGCKVDKLIPSSTTSG